MVQQQGVAWFIIRDGQQHGPVSEQEMQAMIARGLLKPTDMVWRDGFADWQPCHQAFRLAQPAPPPMPQPPPFKGPSAQPTREHGAVPVSEPERVVSDKFANFAISYKTGIVRDVQVITRVSASSSSGGGNVAPSASVSSHTSLRAFVVDGHGKEWHFETGEGFPVRAGNRVRVGFASCNGGAPEGGFVRNLDSGASWRWPMNSILPSWRPVFILAGGLLLLVLPSLGTFFYLLEVSTVAPFFRALLRIPLSFPTVAALGKVTQFVIYMAVIVTPAVVAYKRYLLRKKIRKKLWAAMEA